MKQFLILLSILWVNIAAAQNFLDKVYDPNCSAPDSIRIVVSEFYPLELKLPIGWEGDFEGDLPYLHIKKRMTSKSCQIRLGAAYDSSGIFDWAQESFDPDTFEIITIKGKRVLIEKPVERPSYLITFYQDPGSDDLWVWRLEILGSIGHEAEVICDVTFILEQLIK